MIRLCSCIRGSASTLEPIRKRGAMAACKTCGGKLLVDGRGSLAGSMLGTAGLEITSVVNPDLTWKTVSKGNRSASRRARKSIARNLKGTGELIDKGPKKVEDMTVSESEKLGVSVLGHRFFDKVEHIPIKKRRFLFCSPSPMPRTPSPCPDHFERRIKGQHASGHESSPNKIAVQNIMEMDNASEVGLGQVFDTEIAVDLEKTNENLGDKEDFSGISILAAAACNSSMEGGTGNVEEGSSLEVSSAREKSFEVLLKTELCPVVEESCKDHSSDFAEISNEGTDSCISVMPVEETTASLGAANSSPKDVACGTNMKGPSILDSLSVTQNFLSNKVEGTLRRFGSSLQDDRSHWDLNTVMDVWDSHCDDSVVDSQKDVIGGISEEVRDSEKLGELEACEVQREPRDNKCDIAKAMQPMVGRAALDDVNEDVCSPEHIRSLAIGTGKLNKVDQMSDVCTGIRTTCFQEKALSSEIDCAPNSVMDLAEETKSLDSRERISLNDESVAAASFEHVLDCAVADENASPQCVSFGYLVNGESLSSHQVVNVDDACANHSTCLGADHTTEAPMFEENRDAASTVAVGKQRGDDCDADAEKGENISASPQSEKLDFAFHYAVISEEAICEIDKVPTENGESAGKIYGLHDDGDIPNKMTSADLTTCQPLQPGPSDSVMNNAVNNLDKVDVSSSSPNCERVVDAVAKVHHDQIFVSGITQADSSLQIEFEELADKPLGQMTGMDTLGGLSSHEACRSNADDHINNSDKIIEEDHFEDVDYDLDISQDDPQGIEECELQVGYDSPYEEGEVRESVVHCWEEDACEEGEAEHVDYGSDSRDAYGYEALADCAVSISAAVEHRSECQIGRAAEVNDIDCEKYVVIEKNMGGTNHRLHLGGLSKTNVMEAGSCDKRAVSVNRLLRGKFAKNADIDNFKMAVKVDSELGPSANKVAGDNEFCARGDAANQSTQSECMRMKFSGWDQLPEGRKNAADINMAVRDGSTEGNHTAARMVGHDSGYSVTRVIGSTTSRRELRSCIEGSTSSNVLFRKDRVCRLGSRSNNLEDSNPRVKNDLGSTKSIGRDGSSSLDVHGRGRGGGHWFDSSRVHWSPERHHSPSFGYLGLKNAAAKIESSGFVIASDGTIIKAGGVASDGRHTQSLNPSSQGVHRSLRRRGSPADKDEVFDMHMGLGPGSETSPDRSITVGRGRSKRYGPRVVDTVPRERDHGSVPNDSSSRMQNPLVTRECSYSPIKRRGSTHLSRSHAKSPSRSRTRSPHVWSSPRGRNVVGISSGPGSRHRSRSPVKFRYDARMERVKSPHRRPGFSTHHIVGFVSTSRSRGSPQHASRWINDRKDAVDHFREHSYKQRSSVSERRSTGRIFSRMGSTGRLKPDEYRRPMHPGRFLKMVGVGRGPRYEERDDDGRKHGDKYGFVHPVRLYDTDCPLKRLRYDVKDGCVAPISYNKDATEFHGRGSPKSYDRGIDSRVGDAPRRSRGEKGHSRYGQYWKENANSKPFEMRECDEEDV